MTWPPQLDYQLAITTAKIFAWVGRDFGYRSPTKIPNRDKKTESPYLVHPLTYRQVYLTKDAYFVEKIHCELVEMAVGQRMNKIRRFGFLVTIRNFRRAPVLYH